jgi:hypothetical protein
MLGFGGHIVSKSRRYSTTYTERRQRRRDYRRAQQLDIPVHELADHDAAATVLTIANWDYIGRGYRTIGEASLAELAAQLARSRRERDHTPTTQQ